MAQYSRGEAPFYIKKAKWAFAKVSLSASSFHGLGILAYMHDTYLDTYYTLDTLCIRPWLRYVSSTKYRLIHVSLYRYVLYNVSDPGPDTLESWIRIVHVGL